jgi:phosphoenolpyruvate carboxykinase (ATP)
MLIAGPERRLIGDDEHGWSDDGVCNFGGGCYATVITPVPETGSVSYRTTRMFATVMENVVFDETTRMPDLVDPAKTENMCAAYPLSLIPNIVPEGYANHLKSSLARVGGNRL